MDYFAIDGWVHYATPSGDWLWVTHDAPLITFGQPEVWARRKTPAATHHPPGPSFHQLLVHQLRR